VEVACDPDDVDVPDEGDGSVSDAPGLYYGEGSPEGSQAGCVGSYYTKTDAPRALYGKFSGDCTDEGWILLSGEGG
jgi:hypothetical protein